MHAFLFYCMLVVWALERGKHQNQASWPVVIGFLVGALGSIFHGALLAKALLTMIGPEV